LVVPVQVNPAVFLGTGPCAINGINYSVCSTTSTLLKKSHLL